MEKTTIGTKHQVWFGQAEHTPGGLVRKDLTISKSGCVVSKAQQAAGKDNTKLEKWRESVKKAFGKKPQTVPIPEKVLTKARKLFSKKK
jgi:hypothetical protein